MNEFFTNPLTWSIIIFFVLNLINVILGTMRSILTVKSTPFVAMLINTISYTFYAGIVKLTSGQSMTVVLISTALTNIIGVYVARFILDKLKKDRLWRITATLIKGRRTDSAEITEQLKKYNIEYNMNDIGRSIVFDIFSKTQGESALLKEILDKPDVKHHVIEIEKSL